MRRAALLLSVFFAVPALADTPEFQKGGVMIGLQYGWGLWNLDRAKLAGQVGDADAATLVGDTQNGHSANFSLGYNILGHATIEATITGTGWNLTEGNRGGGGFITGAAHWHPIQIFLKDQPRFYDASVFLGAGYGIMGENRGIDGFVWQWGVDADIYFAKTLAVTVFYRSTQLNMNSFYIDYNNRRDPGNTVNLPQGSGGSFGQVGIGLRLRVSP
ncbi:MAG: hypothetical protein ACJ790_11435 [Myxococcaceae bacterium]